MKMIFLHLVIMKNKKKIIYDKNHLNIFTYLNFIYNN